MANVRPLELTLTGTYPNKILKVEDHRITGSPIIYYIEQRNVVHLGHRFIEATVDAANAHRKNPFPAQRLMYSAAGVVATDERYNVTSVTEMVFYMADGRELTIDLQDTQNTDQNAGEMADIQDFITDWFA